MSKKPNLKRIAELAHKWKNGTITAEEKQEFDSWYNQYNIPDEIEVAEGQGKNEEELRKYLYSEIISKMAPAASAMTPIVSTPVPASDQAPVIMLRPITGRWKRVAVAAAVIIAVSLTMLYLFNGRSLSGANVDVDLYSSISEVGPGIDGAVLKLNDGRELLLDSNADGTLLVQQDVEVIKDKGQLMYTTNKSIEADGYNVMITPRGRQYKVVLADGTKVWLNAASSIKYPVAFKGKERRVNISGEVYFEVAKDRSKPFIVNIFDGISIRVLGTHFNVSAYPEDPTTKTTLLEGSVEVIARNDKLRLAPGQQAELNAPTLKLNNNIDTTQVVAWKSGFFEFHDLDLQSIMHQISRWYDVDIIYEKQPGKETFGGRISRNVNLESVLKGLEITGVKFKMKDNQLIVQP